MSDSRYSIDGRNWYDNPGVFTSTTKPMVIGHLQFYDREDMLVALKANEYRSALLSLSERMQRMLRGKEAVDVAKLLALIPELKG